MTLVRIYIPLNASALRSLAAQGRLGVVPLRAHAVTESVRAWAPTGGQEEWEYAALKDAARTSGTLLTSGEGLRIVAAADVSASLVGTAATPVAAAESEVSISDPVALRRIASFHVGDDASQDDTLLWYDVTELPVVLDLL